MVVTCTTDADCNTDDGEACMSAKPRRFGQENKGGGGAAADADVDSVVADEEEEEEREQRLVCKVPPTECTTDDDCAELEGTSCVARPQKEGATKEAKFFCRDPDAMRPEGGKKGGKGNKGNKGKGKGRGGYKDLDAAAADTDADADGERQRREDGDEETKGSNKNKGGIKKKGGRFLTPCSTDDDCAELDGTSCVARPQKEGATKEAKFFCRDPDAIRPSKGKGKGRSKGKGNGNGGNKAVVDGSD